MQSLLAEIADLACTFEKELQAAENSSYSESHKSELIQELKRRHHERHTPIAMELTALEQRVAQDLQL
jgi:iron-sulfur cluster repair protein YtfE (RIC family)